MAEELTLPEPARSLWLELRDGVRESLREIGAQEYAIGGGTVLSARWNHHRRSHDIDLTVGEKTRIHLLEDEDGSGFAQRMTELGGNIEFRPAGRLIQVRFGEPPNESGLDIWGHELQLGGAQGHARIDGREETVLSTAQILWGKVARGDSALPRDVYDIVEAGRRDPEALGIAVNAHSRSHAESIAMAYYMQGPKIAREGPAQLSGTASNGPAIARLGQQGAEAVEAAYYRGLEILRDGNTVRVTVETASGARRTWSAKYKGVEQLLSTQGLLGDVRQSGGPDMERILEYAKEGCLRGKGSELLYQEKDGRTTAWRTATAGRNLTPGKFETGTDTSGNNTRKRGPRPRRVRPGVHGDDGDRYPRRVGVIDLPARVIGKNQREGEAPQGATSTPDGTRAAGGSSWSGRARPRRQHSPRCSGSRLPAASRPSRASCTP